ncbi:MAG TPA: response regulator [Oscillospiraceae bacterium]|nr:response regulator [Oscillospiraceae bacterium]
MGAMYRVMIVEDDPMVAEIDRNYVEHNAKLTVAGVFSGGVEALDYLRTHSVDLILLDYNMPSMTGAEFLSELRRSGGLQDIIMVTAVKDARMVAMLFSFGLVDYLIKPFDYARFQDALTKYLARKEALDSYEMLTQTAIDSFFVAGIQEATSQYIDKGIQPATLEMICTFLRKQKGSTLSIEDISKEIPLSRVTLRRYMNYLVNGNSVEAGMDYGTGGRPCTMYTYVGK